MLSIEKVWEILNIGQIKDEVSHTGQKSKRYLVGQTKYRLLHKPWMDNYSAILMHKLPGGWEVNLCNYTYWWSDWPDPTTSKCSYFKLLLSDSP